MELTNETSFELAWLREENARLKELLHRHEIAYEAVATPITPIQRPAMPQLSLKEKVALFRSLFRGREDVFARRWYNPKTEKSGYQPVCSREWNPGYCDKKKYKCAECPNREFQPIGYNDIYRHLEGKEGSDSCRVWQIFDFAVGQRPDGTQRTWF